MVFKKKEKTASVVRNLFVGIPAGESIEACYKDYSNLKDKLQSQI